MTTETAATVAAVLPRRRWGADRIPLGAEGSTRLHGTAAESCATAVHDFAPARLRRRAFLPDISLMTDGVHLSGLPWARRPDNGYKCGCPLH